MRSSGFNFSDYIQRLTAEVVARCPALSHIEVDRVLYCVAQARNQASQGVHARITPLRFPGGARSGRIGKHWYAIPAVTHQGREILYAIYFYLPRFQNLGFEQKLACLFHELYHISPRFDGDIRRLGKRKYAHGGSRSRYHAAMEKLVEGYLEAGGGDGLADFLRYDFSQLSARSGRIYGLHLPRVRLIPLRTDPKTGGDDV